MHMNKLRVSWIGIIITSAICLVLARYIWAKEFLEFENGFFVGLGVNPNIKYILTVPVFLFILYGYYRRDAQRLAGTGKSVVSKKIAVFSGASLSLVALYLFFFVGGQNA